MNALFTHSPPTSIFTQSTTPDHPTSHWLSFIGRWSRIPNPPPEPPRTGHCRNPSTPSTTPRPSSSVRHQDGLQPHGLPPRCLTEIHTPLFRNFRTRRRFCHDEHRTPKQYHHPLQQLRWLQVRRKCPAGTHLPNDHAHPSPHCNAPFAQWAHRPSTPLSRGLRQDNLHSLLNRTNPEAHHLHLTCRCNPRPRVEVHHLHRSHHDDRMPSMTPPHRPSHALFLRPL